LQKKEGKNPFFGEYNVEKSVDKLEKIGVTKRAFLPLAG